MQHSLYQIAWFSFVHYQLDLDTFQSQASRHQSTAQAKIYEALHLSVFSILDGLLQRLNVVFGFHSWFDDFRIHHIDLLKQIRFQRLIGVSQLRSPLRGTLWRWHGLVATIGLPSTDYRAEHAIELAD